MKNQSISARFQPRGPFACRRPRLGRNRMAGRFRGTSDHMPGFFLGRPHAGGQRNKGKQCNEKWFHKGSP